MLEGKSYRLNQLYARIVLHGVLKNKLKMYVYCHLFGYVDYRLQFIRGILWGSGWCCYRQS